MPVGAYLQYFEYLHRLRNLRKLTLLRFMFGRSMPLHHRHFGLPHKRGRWSRMLIALRLLQRQLRFGHLRGGLLGARSNLLNEYRMLFGRMQAEPLCVFHLQRHWGGLQH